MTVITLSERGIPVGDKIAGLFDDSKHVVVADSQQPLNLLFADAWNKGPIVSVMATQITVRMIARLVGDKKSDPAVISVDEHGKFVIPLLSGHLGGANKFAKQIAKKLGSQAIVTTASDLIGVPALDELSKELGYNIDNPHNLSGVMTKILNKEKVCLFGDELDVIAIASRYTDTSFEILPIDKYRQGNGSYRIVLTDKDIDQSNDDLILRPIRDHIGIGFRKNTSIDMLKAATREGLSAGAIAPGSIATISTIDIKAGSRFVEELADDYKARVIYYTKEQLSEAAVKSKQSEFVRDSVGVGAVSEPAALLSSGDGRVVLRKFVHGGVALSIAKANWP